MKLILLTRIRLLHKYPTLCGLCGKVTFVEFASAELSKAGVTLAQPPEQQYRLCPLCEVEQGSYGQYLIWMNPKYAVN